MQVDGVSVNEVPSRQEYDRIEVDCGEDATGVWDTTEWGLLVKNINNTKVKCTINFVRQEYTEELLHGSDPVLAENLIPVTIEDNGVVKRADTKSEWYNYANKAWANAVILVDKSITYNANEVIPEENIESYFVWIPKYSYQLFDLGNYNTRPDGEPIENKAKPISIRFGTTNTSDNNVGECTTPMNEERTQGLSGSSGNCKVGDYMTHPAFISMNTNGIWVGKFETTGSTSNLTVKPNVTALTSINASTMFTTAYNYQRELDSHMMKNTEWGAVAYLSHSIYGINKEVNINNNSKRLTGYSATDESDQTDYPGTSGTTEEVTQAYNTETGYKASTTGNISGIYDMSGGISESVAGYITGKIGSSGFTEDPLTIYGAKYFDLYKDGSQVSYKYRILGDAIGELGPFYTFLSINKMISSWYKSSAYIIFSNEPWYTRGGAFDNGFIGGQFNFSRSIGSESSNIGFRVVLAI